MKKFEFKWVEFFTRDMIALIVGLLIGAGIKSFFF